MSGDNAVRDTQWQSHHANSILITTEMGTNSNQTRAGVQVLAVALPRRPLFPGGLMPVSVQNEKLIQELIQLKKGG